MTYLALLSFSLLACEQGDAASNRRAPPGGGDTGEASDTSDTSDTSDDTSASISDAGCAALGDHRGRCTLASEADWSAGAAEGLEVGDNLRLGSGLTAGTFTSAVLSPGVEFNALVPSWNASTPAGTWVSFEVQARVDGTWTSWYRLGVWASGSETVSRHSFEGERDGDGEVWTDTLFLDAPADAARIRVSFASEDGAASPTVTRLAFAFAKTGVSRGEDAGGVAWGAKLDVPARSQMVFDEGEAWCSPTSTSMILAWWALQSGTEAYEVSVPEAAEGTWDSTYGGNGNWPFNVAYAASLGLTGEVGWFDSIDDIEPWIAAGAPVAISAAWEPGEVDGAPISSTAGHLLVVTGFDANGDVYVNDPAASGDGGVPRTYDRRQIEAAWLGGSEGVVYLLWEGERPGP